MIENKLAEGDSITVHGPAIVEFTESSGRIAYVSVHDNESLQVRVIKKEDADIH